MNFKRFFHVFLVLLVIGLLPHIIVWIHHMFVSGLNPYMGPLILIIILLISILLVVRWYKWLRSQWFAKDGQEAVFLFALGAICWVISYALSGNTTADIQLHETYYIISVYYIAVYLAVVFGIFSFIYYLFSEIGKRNLNTKLSRIHFWVTYIGLNLLVIGYSEKRITTMPRHYVAMAGWADYHAFQYTNAYLIVLLSLVLFAQLLFVLNVADSLLSKRK